MMPMYLLVRQISRCVGLVVDNSKEKHFEIIEKIVVGELLSQIQKAFTVKHLFTEIVTLVCSIFRMRRSCQETNQLLI